MTNVIPADDVSAVSSRLEQTFHAITAMHDLCDSAISGTPGDPVTLFVLLREQLRSIARDMENCAVILSTDSSGLGFFEQHYGRV
jgi:hypothetical protein